ncbi:MAG: bifunctional phosphoribosylaminoimidazolecarboxamide formyltransferase/IMP cyclohydrolase [Acidimicrobiia bacterium]
MDLDLIPVRRALVSVWDKAGLVDFCRGLKECGVEIVSSGGTAATLAEGGVAVTLVSEVTGAAEMLGGRVKTLHPRIHGGILARLNDPAHRADLADNQIDAFELVVCNLYPFEETVAEPATTEAEAIEQIDIGGVTLIRAAAKNYEFVGVVTDPEQYPLVLAEIRNGGLVGETRHDLAHAAFFRTASYDAAIVNWLEEEEDGLPERIVLPLERVLELRYGENPHQQAALYRVVGSAPWWERGRLVQGKPLSFNNIYDAEAAWRLVSEIESPGVVIVKHANPCGVATAPKLVDAFLRAWACDPLSAFGGVIALNSPLDEETAAVISERFVEVVVAPEVWDLGDIKEGVRVLTATPPHGLDLDLRRVEDGMLAQNRDWDDGAGWETRSEREPSHHEEASLRLALIVASHAKSNAVVIVNERAAIGVGAGDQSRVGAVEKALRQAGERAAGAVAASDAFFPFPDGVEALAAAGITAIVAPVGSRNDAQVLAAADRLGLAFIAAPRRHFRH